MRDRERRIPDPACLRGSASGEGASAPGSARCKDEAALAVRCSGRLAVAGKACSQKDPALSPPSQDILRATSIRNVLSHCGLILKTSSGSEQTYLLSRPRPSIDVFVSHNWAVSRWQKFWALALHFNAVHATVAAYVCASVGCVLNLMRIGPTLQTTDVAVRPSCMILGTCGFFFTLTFAHDFPLARRLGFHQQVFLDKVCIHQSDPVLKAAGINSLGAFLRVSKQMLVLFSSVYFKKLWTVYEAACYMYVHPRENIKLMPVGIASVVLKSTALLIMVHGFAMLINTVARIPALSVLPDSTGFVLAGGACCIGLAFTLRGWSLQQSSLIADLQSFQISKAACADERDRPVVGSNICAFVRAMGLVEEGASDADALLSFDKLVQEQMPMLLRCATGPTGVPYQYTLVAGIGRDFFTLDEITSSENMTVLEVLATLVYSLWLRTAAFPMVFWTCSWMSNRIRPLGGWAEVALTLGIAGLTLSGSVLLFLAADAFRDPASQSAWWLVAFAAANLAQTLVVAKLFAWNAWSAWRPPGVPATAHRRGSNAG